jgi:hypothetical protein
MTEITIKKNINSTKNPIKKCFKIGSLTVTTIDESIVEEMKINDTATFFEQEITEDGILLRVKDIVF